MTMILESEAFDRIVLAISCAVTFICTDYHANTFITDVTINIVGNVWVCLCVLETLLKIYFVGWDSYSVLWRNKYDFAVILIR